MKAILINLIFLLSITFDALADNGFLADYSVEGSSIGNTKLKGNLKVMISKDSKRLTGNFFYQEAANPFPELDEKDIIINFKKDKKYIFTAEAGEWLSASLKDDYALLDEKNVKISIKKSPAQITVHLDMALEPEFGGKQRYIIELWYNNPTPAEEDKVFLKFNHTSAIDFLSMFIDNEKITQLLKNKLGADKNRSVDKFLIKWEQDRENRLDVKGKLEAKSNIKFTEDDFQP